MIVDSYCHVARAARVLDLSGDQVRRLVDAGKLRAVVVDRVRLIELRDLQRLAAERMQRRAEAAA